MEQAIERACEKMLNFRSVTVLKLTKPIAKKGIVAAGPAFLLCWLCSFFPEATFLKSLFGFSCVWLFWRAALFLGILFSGEVAGGTGKVIETGLSCYRRISLRVKIPQKVLATRTTKPTRHIRNRARAHRSAPRPMFARSSKNSSDDGDSDQGDPPGPSPFYSVTPSHYSNTNLNSFSSPRRTQNLGCWRAPCRKRAARGCVA
jgi:hypothetical protein